MAQFTSFARCIQKSVTYFAPSEPSQFATTSSQERPEGHAIVRRGRLLPLILTGALVTGGPIQFFSQHAHARDSRHPHYELALDADHRVCPQIRDLYDRLLRNLSENYQRSPLSFGPQITNFAVAQTDKFAEIGLTPPKAAAPTVPGPPGNVIEIGEPTTFYSATTGRDQSLRTLAQKDFYRGNSPSTAIAIFQPTVGPTPGTPFGTMDPEVTIPVEDSALVVSVGALARSQTGDIHVPDDYLLTKWPFFDRLFSRYKTRLKERDFRSPMILPALFGAGLGVTIRPFQSQDGSLYFVLDQYGPIREIRQLQRDSDLSVITVVQKLDDSILSDICYLVVAPGALAETLERRNVRH